MNGNRFIRLMEPAIFLLVLGADRWLKTWAVHQMLPFQTGPFLFETHLNFGVMGGTFSHLPVMMKIVTLASVGSFIFCFYLFARIFFPMKSHWLKAGVAFMVSGILGNVWDRLLDHGGVVDFLSLQLNTWRSPVLNPADFFQMMGFVLMSVGLWKDSKDFWFKSDQRRITWILPGFQMRFTLALTVIGNMFGFVTSMMSYAFLRVALQDEQQLNSFLIAICVTQASLTLIALMIGSFVSGKVAGPIFAIKRFLLETLEGEEKTFKLRTGDEFKDFEGPLNEVNEKLVVRRLSKDVA